MLETMKVIDWRAESEFSAGLDKRQVLIERRIWFGQLASFTLDIRYHGCIINYRHSSALCRRGKEIVATSLSLSPPPPAPSRPGCDFNDFCERSRSSCVESCVSAKCSDASEKRWVKLANSEREFNTTTTTTKNVQTGESNVCSLSMAKVSVNNAMLCVRCRH